MTFVEMHVNPPLMSMAFVGLDIFAIPYVFVAIERYGCMVEVQNNIWLVSGSFCRTLNYLRMMFFTGVTEV